MTARVNFDVDAEIVRAEMHLERCLTRPMREKWQRDAVIDARVRLNRLLIQRKKENV